MKKGIAATAIALALVLTAGAGTASAKGGSYRSCGKVTGETGTVKVRVKKTTCKMGKKVARAILSVGLPPNFHGYSCGKPKGDVITCKKGSKRIRTKLISGRSAPRQIARQGGLECPESRRHG